MERGTKEQVDHDLALVEGVVRPPGEDLLTPFANAAGRLAAEVRALRESVDAHLEQRKLALLENDRLREELDTANRDILRHRSDLERECRFYREGIGALKQAQIDRLGDTLRRVEELGSGPGFCMGDDTLIRLGDVRAALREPAKANTDENAP